MVKDNELSRDIKRRFKQEQKYVVDPIKEKHGNHGIMIITSLIMVIVVLVSVLYTFISLGGGGH